MKNIAEFRNKKIEEIKEGENIFNINDIIYNKDKINSYKDALLIYLLGDGEE